MRYRFADFTLDTTQFSLWRGGEQIHVEPLVFDLLRFLIERAGTVVSRETMIDGLWGGRIVSDETVASCIKSARKALGDTGRSQFFIQTVRGRGFKFVAAVERVPDSEEQPAASVVLNDTAASPTQGTDSGTPPRIAVMPLFPISADPQIAVLGDAVAQEVILELSRLHWLNVIARGSTFQFRGMEIDLGVVTQALGADYVVTGTIDSQGKDCAIAIELCHAVNKNVVWAQRFDTSLHDIMHMRAEIAGAIVSALEPRIQINEAMLSVRIPTEQLDAWSAYHRGLWHMYRFTGRDNDQAQHLFERAVTLDPTFARAHSGLSFTHFQNAFLGFSAERDAEMVRMRACAERAMELDALDPFVNLSLGRTEWLAGNPEAALSWMQRAIDLSPNFAFAIYNSALMGILLGEGETSDERARKAISLSPIDPLNYAMLATRALSYLIRGELDHAADWARKAVRSPNAHNHIFLIAAIAEELLGNRDDAQQFAEQVRRRQASQPAPHFLSCFPFRDPAMRAQIDGSIRRLGISMSPPTRP